MTAGTTWPVAGLAEEIESIAVQWLNDHDDTVAFLRLTHHLGDNPLFGEDLWDAFVTYATAVRVRNSLASGDLGWFDVNEHLRGPDKAELAYQEATMLADTALHNLIGDAAAAETREAIVS